MSNPISSIHPVEMEYKNILGWGKGNKLRPLRLLFDKKTKKYYIIIKGKKRFITFPKSFKFNKGKMQRKVISKYGNKAKLSEKNAIDYAKMKADAFANFGSAHTEAENLRNEIRESKKESEAAKKALEKQIEDAQNIRERFRPNNVLVAPEERKLVADANVGDDDINEGDVGDVYDAQDLANQRERERLRKEDEKREDDELEKPTKFKNMTRKQKEELFKPGETIKIEPYEESEESEADDSPQPEPFGEFSFGDPLAKTGMGKMESFYGGKKLPALWSNHIENYFKDYPQFTGVYSSDELATLPKIIPQGLIVNLSKSNEEGSHWVAIYISGDSVEYFDPLANPMPDIMRRGIKHWLEEMKLPILLKFKENKIKQQSDSTETCGYHCIRFLQDRMDGLPFKISTRYGKKKYNTKEGEGVINEEFKFI